MPNVRRSSCFDRRHSAMLANYRERENDAYAARFARAVEDGIDFIINRPKFCAVYTEISGRKIRKWSVREFHAVIFFSMTDKGDITLETIYHQRQNIAARLPGDIG